MTPEAQALQTINALLTPAGWHVFNVASTNLRGATGVAIREFPLDAGHGFADYLLSVYGKACGVTKAKKGMRHPQRDGDEKYPLCPAGIPFSSLIPRDGLSQRLSHT